MTDERLAELHREVAGFRSRSSLGIGAIGIGAIAEEALAEIDRLRAEARPEPIGYVAARVDDDSEGVGVEVWDDYPFRTADEARRDMATFQPIDGVRFLVVALVPVEATP